MEFAVRNLAIAMVIEVSLLRHPDFIAFGALALLGQALLLGASICVRRTSTSARQAERQSRRKRRQTDE